ncbi:GET complex subunit get1, partial [Coemansia furcata]
IEKSASGNSTPKYAEQPKRQRSMPHLRQASGDSMMPSPDIPTEAYFDTLGHLSEPGDGAGLSPSAGGSGGRTNTVANLHSASGVYYTPVPTRLSHQRKLAKRALCSMWLVTAASFVSLQRMDEASNAISEALASWPESPEALTMRGQLYMEQKQYLPALNELHAAVSLESNNIRASVSLACVEHLLGRRDVALGLLKNITRAHGWSDPEAWYWLGRLERELALEQASLSKGNLQGDLVSAILDSIGFSAVASALWDTYCKAVGNQKAAERIELKDGIVLLRRDLRSVSSVDEFAKWAKMRRRLDALSAKFERVSSDLAIERTAFELYVNLVLRVIVYGSRAVLNIYNYRTPVFYVPANWFYPVLWFLSLPTAPMGSVSVSVWSFACNRVCKRAAAIYNRVLKPVPATPVRPASAALS